METEVRVATLCCSRQSVFISVARSPSRRQATRQEFRGLGFRNEDGRRTHLRVGSGATYGHNLVKQRFEVK